MLSMQLQGILACQNSLAGRHHNRCGRQLSGVRSTLHTQPTEVVKTCSIVTVCCCIRRREAQTAEHVLCGLTQTYLPNGGKYNQQMLPVLRVQSALDDLITCQARGAHKLGTLARGRKADLTV